MKVIISACSRLSPPGLTGRQGPKGIGRIDSTRGLVWASIIGGIEDMGWRSNSFSIVLVESQQKSAGDIEAAFQIIRV